MAMVIPKQRRRSVIVMVVVAAVFASLLVVSQAWAIGSQGDTTVRAGNTFYAYVVAGERMRVTWNGVNPEKVLNENGTAVPTDGNGYTPTAASSGVWRVVIPKESGLTSGYTYDISVRWGTDNRPGRIWVYEDKIFQRWVSSGYQDLNYFGVSDLGYLYQIKMNEFNGIDSVIALRSSGAAPDEDCDVENRSFEKGFVDCGDRYRLFFDDPRRGGLPETANMDGETIPVMPDLVTSTDLKSATKVTFKPNVDKIGGSFVVNSHPGFSGTAELQIDGNNNGSYTDTVDVKKTLVVNGGKSATWVWNGKNAGGAEVLMGAGARALISNAGEAHLLLVDVETFGGLTMTRLNGGSSPNSTIYWDDRQLTEARGGSGTPVKSCLNGCNSSVTNGLHGWTRGTAVGGDTESSSWGDGRIINNWSYVAVNATSPEIYLPALRTIRFDANGGDLSGVSSITRTNGTAWGALPTATADNLDFQGWYTTRAGGTQVTASTVATGSLTAYAHWTPTDRTLKFNANGGSINGVSSITKPHGSAWGTLPTASRANMDFDGWYTTTTGGTQITSSTVATADDIAYAHWSPTDRTLKFNANGGSINGVSSITKPHGSAWGTLPTASKANMDFDGWFTASSGGTQITASTVATADDIAYAHWTPTDRTLTFNANGGSINGVSSITKPHGSAWGTLPTASKANMDFDGWFTASSGGTQITASTVATADDIAYAHWSPTDRTLTFNANGGSINGVSSITKPHGSAWGTLPTASRANMDFDGWFTTSSGGTQVTAATVATGNLTVYAHWSPTPRTLTFNPNGGSINGVSSITKPHGSAWGTLPTASKANMDFDGWFTASSGGTQITASTVATADDIAYAHWTPTDRTLTFNANGGTINGTSSITKPHGSAWGTLPTASKANMDFDGWFTASSGGAQVTASTVATGNLTVYAHWTPTPRTLTFNPNGGSINGASSITKPHGTAWGTLPTASKANMDFDGWFTATTGGTQITASTVATADDIAYAHWTPTPRTLTFNPNGGTISGVSRSRSRTGLRGTLPTASKANMDFLGWFTATTGGTQVTASTVATGDLTVYAHWTPTPRTLTFNPNGGTISGVSSITKPHGTAWGTLPTASKANMDFLGWFTATTGGTQVTASTVATGDLTVYAHWTPTPRTLTFDANGGSINGVTSITKPHGTAWGTLPTASASGKVFLGWYTAKAGGTQVTAATVATGSITAYAQWRPARFNVVFNGNAQMGTITGAMASIWVDSGCTACLLPANGFTKTTGAPELIDHDGETAEVNSTFLGWSLDPLSRTGDIADRAVAGNLSLTDGATVRLYAIWDDAPRFIVTSYPDRFFGLNQAKAGAITEAELLRTVKATDKETNPLAPKTSAQVLSSGSDVGVTLFDYAASDFTSMTASGVVTATYKVKDELAHVAFLRIRVTVSDDGPVAQDATTYLRGISPGFASKGPGAGGLSADSLWKTDPTRVSALDRALSGTSATTYCLGTDAITDLRTLLRDPAKGLGNSKAPDGLATSVGILRATGACP